MADISVTATVRNSGGLTASKSATITTTTSGGGGQQFNITCSGNITSALQSAISQAKAGDTINISAGNGSMSAINVSDKNITIKGAGKGVTNITAQGGFGQWITNGSNSPTWRLSGISFSGTGKVVPLTVWADQAAAWRGPFRIDHCEFNYPSGGASVYLFGPIYGLIDHCKFVSSYELAIFDRVAGQHGEWVNRCLERCVRRIASLLAGRRAKPLHRRLQFRWFERIARDCSDRHRLYWPTASVPAQHLHKHGHVFSLDIRRKS